MTSTCQKMFPPLPPLPQKNWEYTVQEDSYPWRSSWCGETWVRMSSPFNLYKASSLCRAAASSRSSKSCSPPASISRPVSIRSRASYNAKDYPFRRFRDRGEVFPLTCSTWEVGGNISFTSVWRDVYDLTSIRWLMATSPCSVKKIDCYSFKYLFCGDWNKILWWRGVWNIYRHLGWANYLWVDDEDLTLGDSDLPVTQLICVPVSKACIEGIVIWREQRFDILQNLLDKNWNKPRTIWKEGSASLRKQFSFLSSSALFVFS